MTQGVEAVAVLGISGRFPAARNVDEFWENLRSGRLCTTFFTDEELLEAGTRPQDLQAPNYVRANGVINGADLFDAGFFGFSPRDAEILDPQQRLFLECSWEVLEDGGYNPETYPGLIGVIGGTTMSTYAFNLYSNQRLAGVVNNFQILIGNDKDHLTTRVAYKLGLRGPAITLGTACSTSLVAISIACQNLLDYQCDMALAGGVTIGFPQKTGYFYEEGGISSPDGLCRSFDSAAKGTVGGNGVAVVLLKRLSEAIADHDPIRAVIRGYGLNNDGSAKVGYTAPSITGQAQAIAMALAMANVSSESITLLEAHGTATPLGDPIEFSALTEAYRNSRKKQYCALGSVKSNVGHMDSAAGAAGFIKCVLSLEHREIPPSLHFEKPNPKIDLANSPFYVPTKLEEWQAEGQVRRAGVSSFGIGGTNAHVVLEEAPPREPSGPSRPYQILGISARSSASLDDMTAQLGEYLSAHPELPLADVAYTMRVGRKEMTHRRCLIVPTENPAEAARLLKTKDPRHVFSSVREGKTRQVAFLFPGQGAQYSNMGRMVYQNERTFRAAVDQCCSILAPLLELDLRTILFPQPEQEQSAAAALQQTYLTQPAVFTISYAYAQLWMSWGVRPVSMIGHSVGEYVAACISGVFSLPDALQLIAYRGRLMHDMPAGGMLAVAKAPDELIVVLNGDLELAAVNAPGMSVISGPLDKVARLEQDLRSQGVSVTRLHTSHAFHSRLMETAIAPMEAKVARTMRHPPAIPFLSNVTGNWIRADEAQSPVYWGRHLRCTVRFADGLAHLFREPDTVLLEVGPGTTLTSLARQNSLKQASQPVFSSARHPLDQVCDERHILQTGGRLWLEGTPLASDAFYKDELRHRLHLPTYCFERQRYWIEPSPEIPPLVTAPSSARLPLDDWFYIPRWIRVRPAPPFTAETLEHWLVLGSDDELTTAVCEQLRAAGQQVVRINQRNERREVSPDVFQVSPDDRSALTEVLRRFVASDFHPRRIIHLWNLENSTNPFYSSLCTLQAVVAGLDTSPVDLILATSHAQNVLSSDTIVPEKAMAYAPTLTVPQEYPHIRCRMVDIDDRTLKSPPDAAQRLIDEAVALDALSAIAYRGPQRWLLTYEPAPLSPVEERHYPGTYLVTGGLGKIGLLFSEFLARRGASHVVLVGRSVLPAREDWDEFSDSGTRAKIARIRAIEALGARVTLESVNVADRESMASIFGRHRFNGIIHGAGLTSSEAFSSFSSLDTADCESHFAPKVNGTRIIAELAHAHEPEFVCFLSSLSALLGGLGFTAYAAANQYLDAFAWAQRPHAYTRWISINWDGWMLDGDALLMDQDRNQPVIFAEEGTDALDRILAADDLTQVVVSTTELGRRFEQWVNPSRLVNETIASPSSPEHPRPAISTTFEPPNEGDEQQIARIWSELLGLEQVGANDNFFELGGHSLLAIQVVSRLRERLQRDLPVRILFDHPTVRLLAAAINELGSQETAMPDIGDLLDKVERMTDEEARALLDQNLSRSAGAM